MDAPSSIESTRAVDTPSDGGPNPSRAGEIRLWQCSPATSLPASWCIERTSPSFSTERKTAVSYRAQARFADLGKCDHVCAAHEQLHVQQVFEIFNLMADGSLGQIEFDRHPRKAEMATCRLKGAQAHHRWHTVTHKAA